MSTGFAVYDVFWLFLIYAVLGWCAEVIYAALKNGKFVNRGFLSGPVCPIYGFGVLFVLLLLAPLEDQLFLLFLGSVAITTLIEFVTGFLLEKIFHDKWWDYSGEHFNVKGYICLRFSILWGLACVFVVRLVEPSVEWLYSLLPHTAGVIVLCICYVGLLADFAVTVIGISQLPGKVRRLAELEESTLKDLSERMGQGLSDGTLDMQKKAQEIEKTAENVKLEKERDIAEFLHSHQEQAEEIRHLAASFDERRKVLFSGKNLRGIMERRILHAFPQFGKVRAEILKKLPRE